MNNNPNLNTKVCPKCGSVEPAGNAFCKRCGAPLGAAPAQPAQPAQPARPAPAAAPKTMDFKSLFFIIGLCGVGLYLFSDLVYTIINIARYGDFFARFINFLGTVGYSGFLASILLYFKSKTK